MPPEAKKEGGLEPPLRHPILWQSPEYHDTDALNSELERVFDICHGCRRCVSLCDAFPTLFDLVDESPTFELDGVDKSDYEKVSDQCYLCDLCFQTKCPYVPPHEFNLDFPHLMLRARSKKFADKGSSLRDRLLAATDSVSNLLTIPIMDITANALTAFKPARAALQALTGIHKDAALPKYHRKTARKRMKKQLLPAGIEGTEAIQQAGPTRGRVAIYSSCYCNSCEPDIVEDLAAILTHNGIETRLIQDEKCCGMPQLELGNLQAVQQAKESNIPHLAKIVRSGWDLMAPIPSCVLMYRQEIPLLFPDDDEVNEVAAHIFDPFEYLGHRHHAELLQTSFAASDEKNIFYQVACHQRVQNFGMKTRDVLQLIPGVKVQVMARCSGHDGSYAVRSETRAQSVRIAQPIVREIDKAKPDALTSDCPLALRHLESLSQNAGIHASHPISILRSAYGI